VDSPRNKRGAPHKSGMPVELGERRADQYDMSDQIDLSDYLFTISRRWRLVAVTILLTLVATFVVTKFVMSPWYRAEAILRPVGQNVVLEETTGMLSGIGGASALGSLATGILGNSSGSGDGEYVPTLTSFAFTDALVKKHKLREHLLAQERSFLSSSKEDPDWVVYRILKRRFECRFAQSSGNLTLYYLDRNRSDAERILGFFIDDLREILRSRQVRDTTEAIASLHQEAIDSSDALIRDQLYELIARQIQRQKMAQVQADFAFIEIAPPTSPDTPYKPSVLLDCAIMGLLSAIGVSVWVLVRGGPAKDLSLTGHDDEQGDVTLGTAQKALR